MRETGQPKHKGYYHPDFRDRIEELETRTLRHGRFLKEEGPVRYYWLEFPHTIGASEGEQTPFILVEHHAVGEFHGHPVKWEELRRKGTKDEDRYA